jgi:hypothetical protein
MREHSMNFSQRMGLEPAVKPIQDRSMDDALRNSLWNAFDLVFLEDSRRRWDWVGPETESRNPPNEAIFVSLWMDFFKWQLPTLPKLAIHAANEVQRWFSSSIAAPWDRIYQFVEFIGNLKGDVQENTKTFRNFCNCVLQRECSAYRFVGKTISPITNEAEIKAIEQAARTDHSLLRPVSIHIETALKLFSDKKQPDYRNSMKESISAVEALAKIIAKNDKATLGSALDAIAKEVVLHPSLQEGFKK